MSDYFDYIELRSLVYEMYKTGVWDGLSQEIQQLYWRDLQRLRRRVKADNKKYERSLSLERAEAELGFVPLSPFSVEDDVIRREFYRELYAVINNLKKEQRDVIIMYYFEGKTERGIAKALGISQGTANYQKKKSLKELREFLEDSGEF